MSQAATAERHTDESQRPRSGISPRVVFNAVWRHPVAFAGVILCALVAGLGIWFFLPLPKMTAAVVFQVSSNSPSLVTTPGDSRADFATYKQSQIALITSRRTFSTALNGLEVKALEIFRTSDLDEMTWLDKHVKVESKVGSELVRMTIEGNNDRELLKLLTALKDAYIKLAHDRDNSVRITRLKDLEDRHKVLDEQVKAANNSIEKNRSVVGHDDGSFQFLNDLFRQEEYKKALLAHEQLSYAERARLEDLDAARKYLAGLRKVAQRTAVLSVAGGQVTLLLPDEVTNRAPHVPAAAIESELRKDAGLQQLEAAVALAREHVAQIRETALGAPLTKALETLKTAEENRDRYRYENRPLIEAKLKEGALLNAELHLEKMLTELEQSKLEKERAWRKVGEHQEKLKGIKDAKEAIKKLQDGIADKEPLAKQLAIEIEKLKLDLGTQSRVTVHDEPFVIQGIEGNRRLKYALMAGLGAFVLGFGGLVLWEHRGRRVTRTEEVSTELGTRLIGTIPPIVSGGDATTAHEVNSPMVEAIDTTRIMLTHAGTNGSKLRVLMVTSAVSGEGKTTLSGNLAISLTRAGFRTLLIDGDMQAPSAHVLFDIPDAPGLSELLRGETDLARAVRPSPIPGLSILPAGHWNISTRQSLVGDRWRTLKQQLESEFDFVVIDTSPLLMVSDAMLLAREADGVVLSVLLGVSQIARVAETVNRLQAIGAELAGVVVNNVQSEVYRRYMSRSKYAATAPVAPDQEEMAFADEDEAGSQEALAEEIGVGAAGKTKEGSQ